MDILLSLPNAESCSDIRLLRKMVGSKEYSKEYRRIIAKSIDVKVNSKEYRRIILWRKIISKISFYNEGFMG